MSATAGADPLAMRQANTLSTLVAERMEGSILAGDLPVGERINEATLARELGVSRGPIREAMRLLAARGLIEFVANKGAFVRKVADEEMAEIYDLRAVLTGHACRRAAASPDRDPDALARLHGEMQAAADSGDAEAYYRFNLAFHDALVEMAGSPRLAEMLGGLIRVAHLNRQVSLARHPDMARSNVEHGRIVEAIRAGDEAAARRHGEAHVRAGRARFDAARTKAG